ncbi:nucleoside-diphosphate kinase [Caldithrix abyssi]|uniref:Nucleoside diphosphate kinase n=1 Tax=Caldithrix abyssi DSM 13497 TaxID=880073 RepID=H1XSA6_CALAY|nr:nucleoside-diphosphate kinase [Caldithrix abyssi]APF20211.1 ndk nucleoside diphosphate kinase [Caldithrix abyssi DSM 13497]EHO40270.1 Nucleoside diphosphate kinase [Caldithrix abyssi DSM 13497]
MKERTLAILKPDCVQKGLIGKVIDHLLNKGFDIIGMKMVHLTKQTAGEFYAVHKGRPFYDELVDFMTESPVVVMALEKENAVAGLREVIGATDPAEAAEGTVRRLYAESKGRNIIHASDSPENAKIELGFFFSNKELIENGYIG